MTDELVAMLAGGGTLVTANARLARSLQHEFGARQLASGLSAWPTPAIMTWTAFVQGLWEPRSHQGAAPPLTPVQDRALWERIVEESPDSAGLIQPHAAARLAGEAWRLVQDWRIPLGGKKHAGVWAGTSETSTFQGWAQQFQFHTRWLDRMDSARLPALLMSAGVVAGPRELWLAGFDELTPQQLELIAALEKSGTQVTRWAPARQLRTGSVLAALSDSTAEVEVCAEWCRRRLAENPGARIGVVAQDLEQRRHRFARAFRLAAPGAFHISLGPPLTARPLVAAALRLLEFGAERVSWDTVSSLLLSPWVAGFAEERGRRAACEVALRRWRASELTAGGVARHGACPPILSRALWQVDTLRRQWPDEQKPGAWSAAFAGILDAFGWPGSDPVSSEEYQAVEAWRAALSELASANVAVPASGRHRALEMLRRLVHDKPFEVESAGEPIQIMGALESAGAGFDYLWIAGMNDEVWPGRPSPNPFVPLALHRQYNLPHSSPARELDFASRVSQRLLRSAGEVVVSYAMADAEREMAPSPLFAGLPVWFGSSS